jgi:hypothetical protein
MADYQRVVELLRDLRQGPLQSGGTISEELTQLASQYAALCVHANDRLRQCSVFLQQGLRTEAIHLAEQSPNLLDLVAALDLPDQQAWIEFCQNNGLAVPPLLQVDRAAQLNDAYAQDQPLEQLLARHRLLALARAPVRRRLDTMRKIAELDGANANWEKDIRVFERARIRELPSMFYAAVKNHDDQSICGLMEELQQPWYEPLPADLTTAVSDAYGRVKRAAVEEELRSMVEPLREAFAARSLQECQALALRWKNAMGAAGVINIAPELIDEIRPVVAFINEQTRRDAHLKRFREACRAFTHLLDQDAPDAQLETGYARLKEFNEEIPEELTERYAGKKTGRRQATERSHKTRLIAIGSVAATVVVITLVVLYLQSVSAASKGWAEKIEAAVRLHTREGHDRAQGYVSDLQKNHAGLLKQPVIAAAVNDFQSQDNELASDSSALQILVHKAEDARRIAEPVVADASAGMPQVLGSVSRLQGVLDEVAAAKSLAWVDAENRLGASRSSLQGDLASLAQRLTTDAAKQLEQLSTELEAVPLNPTTPASVADARAKISSIADRVGVLKSLPLLGTEVRGGIAALDEKVSQRRGDAEASRSIADELQNVRTHAGSAGELQAALEEFVKRFPADARAKDFAAALERMGLARSLEAWKQTTATLGTPAAGALPATQKKLDIVNAYLAENPESPLGGPIMQYADYLHRAFDAESEKGVWQTSFSDLITTPMLRDLGIMQISDGRRYYVLGDPKRTERKINSAVSVSFEGLDVNDLTKRIQITVDAPLTVSPLPAPAPHTVVVGEIADSLRLINEFNWDTYGIDVTDKVVHTDMDLVVKAILVLRALKTESAVAGWALDDMYERPISELSRQTPEQLRWEDPSKISDGTRRAIKQTLDALPPAISVKQKIAAAKQALFKSLMPEFIGSGVLLRDDGGAWTLYTASSVLDGSRAFVLMPPAKSAAAPAASVPASAAAETPAASMPAALGAQVPSLFNDAVPAPVAAAAPAAPHPGSMLAVGTMTGGKFVLDTGALRNVPEGSIVYITRH